MFRKNFLRGVLIGSLIFNTSPAVSQLSSKDAAAHYYKSGLDYLQSSEWNRAAANFDIVLQFDPNYANVRKLGALAHYNAAVVYLRHNKNLDYAKAELQSALKIDPEYYKAQELLAEIPMRKGLGEEWRAYNERQEEAKRIEGERQIRGSEKTSSPSYSKVEPKQTIGSQTASQITQKSRPSQRRQNIGIYVTDESGSGIAKDILLSKLFAGKPEHVSITEVTPSEYTPGKEKKTIVMVNVSMSIDQHQYAQPGSVNYRGESTIEPNPEYEEALAAYERILLEAGVSLDRLRSDEETAYYREDDARRRLEELQERRRRLEEEERGLLNSTQKIQNLNEQANTYAERLGRSFEELGRIFEEGGIRSELSKVRRRLEKTPMYREVPAYASWDYQTTTVTKACEATVSYRIIGPSGETTYIDTITKSAKAEDRTVENSNPSLGIYDDPLILPSDSELAREVLEGLGGELSESIYRKLLELY